MPINKPLLVQALNLADKFTDGWSAEEVAKKIPNALKAQKLRDLIANDLINDSETLALLAVITHEQKATLHPDTVKKYDISDLEEAGSFEVLHFILKTLKGQQKVDFFYALLEIAEREPCLEYTIWSFTGEEKALITQDKITEHWNQRANQDTESVAYQTLQKHFSVKAPQILENTETTQVLRNLFTQARMVLQNENCSNQAKKKAYKELKSELNKPENKSFSPELKFAIEYLNKRNWKAQKGFFGFFNRLFRSNRNEKILQVISVAHSLVIVLENKNDVMTTLNTDAIFQSSKKIMGWFEKKNVEKHPPLQYETLQKMLKLKPKS